jgi:formylglycine-generating enzyme required for sulfatase activity
MRYAWKTAVLTAAIVVSLAPPDVALVSGRAPKAVRAPVPDLVELPPGAFQYRASGNFTHDGKPALAPLVTAAITRTLVVMRHQVTADDYRHCVEAGACASVDRRDGAADRPVVKVSWRDADAYAAWLSRETGQHFRLPTDVEWAFAAAGRFTDDALPRDSDNADPGRRALVSYDMAADREAVVDKEPRPIGSFGANENGLLDVAGNVWEWTATCLARSALDARGEAAATTVNCGVRVVEGRHRTYVADFIRDARAGGCSVGVPPSNLGFRLARDDDRWRGLRSLWESGLRLVGLGA